MTLTRVDFYVATKLPTKEKSTVKTFFLTNFCWKKTNAILFPKLFWPTERKKCSCDWEKGLKFEAEAWKFEKCLKQNACLTCSLRFLRFYTLEQLAIKAEEIIGIWKSTGKVRKLFIPISKCSCSPKTEICLNFCLISIFQVSAERTFQRNKNVILRQILPQILMRIRLISENK